MHEGMQQEGKEGVILRNAHEVGMTLDDECQGGRIIKTSDDTGEQRVRTGGRAVCCCCCKVALR